MSPMEEQESRLCRVFRTAAHSSKAQGEGLYLSSVEEINIAAGKMFWEIK